MSDIKGLDNEGLRNQLEDEFQKYLESKEKKLKTEIIKSASVKSSYPWEELNDHDYEDFMMYVSDEWECEQYKERYIRSYNQVLWDCWKIFSK